MSRFPPPNALVTRLAQRGQTAPDGQATFTGFLRLAGPSNSGLVAFESLENVSKKSRRLVLYIADTGGLTEIVETEIKHPQGAF